MRLSFETVGKNVTKLIFNTLSELENVKLHYEEKEDVLPFEVGVDAIEEKLSKNVQFIKQNLLYKEGYLVLKPLEIKIKEEKLYGGDIHVFRYGKGLIFQFVNTELVRNIYIIDEKGVLSEKFFELLKSAVSLEKWTKSDDLETVIVEYRKLPRGNLLKAVQELVRIIKNVRVSYNTDEIMVVGKFLKMEYEEDSSLIALFSNLGEASLKIQEDDFESPWISLSFRDGIDMVIGGVQEDLRLSFTFKIKEPTDVGSIESVLKSYFLDYSDFS